MSSSIPNKGEVPPGASGVSSHPTTQSHVERGATSATATASSPSTSTCNTAANEGNRTNDTASSSPTAITPVNLLLLVTGSVAAIKFGLLLDQLQSEVCHIRIAATSSAMHFLQRAQPSRTGIPFHSIITDDVEWSSWEGLSDTVLHIELRKWADLVVLVPLDANSLAKIATGICDNVITCVMRAWEVGQKPVLLCPAMNTAMYQHPVTDKQLRILQQWYSHPSGEHISSNSSNKNRVAAMETNETEEAPKEGNWTFSPNRLPSNYEEALFQVVGPVSKRLACGDIGVGGMAAVEDIAAVLRHTISLVREHKQASFSTVNPPQPLP